MLVLTVLEPEGLYPDTELERRILGPGVRLLQGNAKASLAELPDALLAEAEGLMTLRMAVPADQIARMPKLRVVVRMGVGYDRVDRVACAARGIKVCNVPDYGTMEVAEFAVLLALSLRRGLLLYHDGMRQAAPIPWAVQPSTLHRRQQVQRFGILGLGRYPPPWRRDDARRAGGRPVDQRHPARGGLIASARSGRRGQCRAAVAASAAQPSRPEPRSQGHRRFPPGD